MACRLGVCRTVARASLDLLGVVVEHEGVRDWECYGLRAPVNREVVQYMD